MSSTGSSWKKGEASDKALQTILAIGVDIEIPDNVGMLDVLGIEKNYKARQNFRNYMNMLEARGQIRLERYKIGSQNRIRRIVVMKAPNPVVVEKAKVAKDIAEKVVIDPKSYIPDFPLSNIPLLKEYMVNKTKIGNHLDALKELGVTVTTNYETDSFAEEAVKVFQYCRDLIVAIEKIADDATMQMQSVVMQRDTLQIEHSDAVEKLAKWYDQTPFNGKVGEDTKSGKTPVSVDPSASQGRSKRQPNQNERPVV